MPIISPTDGKTLSGRLAILAIYLLLSLGGAAMVLPFLVMATGSTSNAFDYERRSPLPRHLWSREDRFMRMLATYFPASHRGSLRQMRACFADLPADWQTWAQIGDDRTGSDRWARAQLHRLDDPARRAEIETAARDYRDFAAGWDLRETILAYDTRYVAPFLRARYGTLERFNAAWEVSVDDFSQITAPEWSGEPIDQPGYAPITDTRYADLLAFRRAYREQRFTPFLAAGDAFAGYLRPAAMRYLWEDFVEKERARVDRGVGVRPSSFVVRPSDRLPFPVPADAPAPLRRLWLRFLQEGFPLRHVRIRVDERAREAFREFLRRRFRTPEYMARILERPAADWSAVPLMPAVPEGTLAKVWMDFTRTEVPPETWEIRDTLPERAFQQFALRRHGSLEEVNRAYGSRLTPIEELEIPFGPALLATFAHHEWDFERDSLTTNYRTVADFLFYRGYAVRNTLLLVALSLLVTLTVNPLAGYALSRFRLRRSEQVIVFCLATMAFPAAVAAIPGFLLLRDLGLLNTFAALVLPGAANGMSIFLLKGFFDSLPKELYEAATIDGAPEWQIFARITLPLVKPILAVSLLNAFLAAYNGWEWALIVCQDPRMWTVSVWTYQFYQTLTAQPYTVMAAYILNSLPVLLVFLFCQKIIMRGIVLPQMK